MSRLAAWIGGAVAALVGSAVVALILLALPNPAAVPPVFGVSFSAPHARGLGLDERETYRALLDDLGVRHLRLAAYWDVLEPHPGQYDFNELDWQLDAAARRQVTVILAVGRKLPRWPECHVPAWAEALDEAEAEARVLQALEAVVTRYRTHPAVQMWQLENEPLLDFGQCPPADREFFSQEEALLRSLDSRPILITDSGELNWWLAAARWGDVLGTTMYRTVWSGRTNTLFHYDYLFPAWLYRAKARLVWLVRQKPVIISELQGEPWGSAPYPALSVAERRASFSPERMLTLRNFAVRTGLPEAYWWGVEYWYWEKERNDEPAFWELARTFFSEP